MEKKCYRCCNKGTSFQAQAVPVSLQALDGFLKFRLRGIGLKLSMLGFLSLEERQSICNASILQSAASLFLGVSAAAL